MFDSTSLEHTLDKDRYKQMETPLRDDLLSLQFDLQQRKAHTVLVLINGADGAGKGEVLNQLYEWLDDHYVDTLSYDNAERHDPKHPTAWKYWRDMPSRGRIGLVLGSWYHAPVLKHMLGETTRSEFFRDISRIKDMEEMLEAEGVRFLKLWLYLDPKESRKRLKAARSRSGFNRPLVEEWPMVDTPKERKRLTDIAFEAIEHSASGSEWVVIPAGDERYRDMAVGKALAHLLERTLAEPDRIRQPPAVVPQLADEAKSGKRGGAAKQATALPETLPYTSILTTVDLTSKLDNDSYRKQLAQEQRRVFDLTASKAFHDRGLICVFEGNDAAGKGGAIRRLRAALDPRDFRVFGTSAPSQEELAHPYLWRFWRRVPPKGKTVIFDRSWYGRVLVERVERLCSESDWMRAYDEINDFERQLDDAGYVVVKFWLAISPEEQLQRFKERTETSFKRFKITPEDWRNRDKWDLYERAVTDMVDRTSTTFSPWRLVPAEDKKFSRVDVLRAVADRLEAALKG